MPAGLDGGKFAALLKLDALIPIAGSKRCIGEGYEFVYPAKWLADVTLYRRRIESAELQRGLAFQQFEQQERVAQRQRAVEPAVAFGPQGSTGEDNISVIAASSPGLVCAPPPERHCRPLLLEHVRQCVGVVMLNVGACGGPHCPGSCRLENLGSPEQVAEFLLDKRIARPGSGYAAELLRATSRDDSRGQKYYELEYQVKREGASGWRRHNISVLCAKEGVLYTLNAQSSADKWELYASQYRLAADSFALR